MKRVKIAELKNRLSYYLRFVRRGEAVLVYDRERAIARIDPVGNPSVAEGGEWIAELERLGVLRRPAAALPRGWLQRRASTNVDVVGALLDERRSGR